MRDTVTQHFVSQNLHRSAIPYLNNLKSVQPQFAYGFVGLHYVRLFTYFWLCEACS